LQDGRERERRDNRNITKNTTIQIQKIKAGQDKAGQKTRHKTRPRQNRQKDKRQDKTT
jgi:hypothetical protein